MDFLSENVFDNANWDTIGKFNWDTGWREGKTKEKLKVYIHES